MPKDILLDENYDLDISTGDIEFGDTTQQDVELIMMSQKGDWKQHPTLGFGITKYINSNVDPEKFKRDLIVALENAEFENPVIDLSGGFENLKVSVVDE